LPTNSLHKEGGNFQAYCEEDFFDNQGNYRSAATEAAFAPLGSVPHRARHRHSRRDRCDDGRRSSCGRARAAGLSASTVAHRAFSVFVNVAIPRRVFATGRKFRFGSSIVCSAGRLLPITHSRHAATVDQSLQAKRMAANFAKLPRLIKARLIKRSCWSRATPSCDPRRIF
jgi:hypothetical protein